MLRMATLFCYWNRKIIAGKESISYEGISLFATAIRATVDEFVDKLYHLTRYYTFRMACSYPVPKKYNAEDTAGSYQ